MTLGSNPKTDLLVKLPAELAQRLVARINGADVSEYIAALIRADLERPSASATPGPEFTKAVELASRFMDRYQNAYKELSK